MKRLPIDFQGGQAKIIAHSYSIARTDAETSWRTPTLSVAPKNQEAQPIMVERKPATVLDTYYI